MSKKKGGVVNPASLVELAAFSDGDFRSFVMQALEAQGVADKTAGVGKESDGLSIALTDTEFRAIVMNALKAPILDSK